MMIRCSVHGVVLGLVLAAGLLAAPAEGPGPPAQSAAARPRKSTESVTAWAWFHEVPLPEAKPGDSPWVDFILPPEVFDKAKSKLGDLRLFDAGGKEVPYALRERHDQFEQQSLQATEFNRQKNPDRSVEVSLDLGTSPIEYQEIEIVTNGRNYRRRVLLEGSTDRETWGSLLEKAYLVHFRIESKDAADPNKHELVHVDRLRFPDSRFRYLRVRVFPDSGVPDDAPVIRSATVYHTVRKLGEYVTLPATLGSREPTPTKGPKGGWGSRWIIEMGSSMVPCERFEFDVADEDFARPYRLEKVLDEEGNTAVVKSGEWRRRAGDEVQPMEISFPEQKVEMQQYRLVVTDHGNLALKLTAVRYTAAVRQIVFARSDDLTAPLRLYVGQPKAKPPYYDFGANLPEVLEPAPVRVELGSQTANPVYQPEPKPWTERWPWLVYVVLGTAGVALFGMLGGLARSAVIRHDAA